LAVKSSSVMSCAASMSVQSADDGCASCLGTNARRFLQFLLQTWIKCQYIFMVVVYFSGMWQDMIVVAILSILIRHARKNDPISLYAVLKVGWGT
jgi:hypothetical protein